MKFAEREVAGTRTRRHTMGLIPVSQNLTCRIASASAARFSVGTRGFGRRFIPPDYCLSSLPSPDTPEILMLSYKGALNVAIFIDFMKRLLKDAKQKVFLIVDNLRVHHAKAVQDWLARHKVEIEICYLPAYAPGHNPDEYLNNDLKQTIKNKPRAKTRDDLVAATSSILKSIQRRPAGSSHTFTPNYVRYAA